MVMLKERKLEPFDWLRTGFHGLVPKLELGNQGSWSLGTRELGDQGTREI